MKLTVSSDVRVDETIIHAMTMPEPTPFEELLKEAQKALDRLSMSKFFRRFIREKLEEIRMTKVLRIARASNQANSEWLVITPEFRIRFMRRVGDEDLFYDYGDQEHEAFLLKKAALRLEQMGMQWLITRFGKPSFTIEDIEAELVRNGKLTIFTVRDGTAGTRELNLSRTFKNLQFDTTVVELGYHERVPTIEDGEFIILLDIEPTQKRAIKIFYDKLSATQRRHLWTTKLDDYNADSYYLRQGINIEVLRYPGLEYCIHLPEADLLQMLSNMFSEPE